MLGEHRPPRARIWSRLRAATSRAALERLVDAPKLCRRLAGHVPVDRGLRASTPFAPSRSSIARRALCAGSTSSTAITARRGIRELLAARDACTGPGSESPARSTPRGRWPRRSTTRCLRSCSGWRNSPQTPPDRRPQSLSPGGHCQLPAWPTGRRPDPERRVALSASAPLRSGPTRAAACLTLAGACPISGALLGWTRTRRPVAVLTCASFLQQCGHLYGPRASTGPADIGRASERTRGCVSSCYRSLSTVAPGAGVVVSSRPANGPAASRVRMSCAWRASLRTGACRCRA